MSQLPFKRGKSIGKISYAAQEGRIILKRLASYNIDKWWYNIAFNQNYIIS